MKCKNCGKETPDNQKYCQHCGSKIKTKEHIAGIIIIVLSIIFFMIISAYFFVNIIINNNNSVVRVPVTTKNSKTTVSPIVTEEPTTIEPTTEEPTTEKPTEPPTEKPTDITEPMTLLYDDSEISVYYSDVESSRYYDDRVELHLFVENKMDKQIEVQADTVILDGISYNKIVCSDPISANSRGMVEVTVDDCNNTSPSTVGADLRYFNIESLRDTVRLNIVSQSVK